MRLVVAFKDYSHGIEFAAHWRYKIGEGDEESELNAWLKTIKDILDWNMPCSLVITMLVSGMLLSASHCDSMSAPLLTMGCNARRTPR